MSMKFVSCSFLLLLLVMHADGSGGREMADDHWKDLINHDRDSKQVKLQGPSGYELKNEVQGRINVLRLPSMDYDRQSEDDSSAHSMVHAHQHATVDDHDGEIHAHPLSHMEHMDRSMMVFFTLNDLKVGKSMPIYFPKKDPSTSPHLLPREEADSIPFSLKQLPHLLQFFSFLQDSPQAKAMEDTLRQCETKAIKGETKFCATSLESILDFARSIFGLNSYFKILTTAHLTKSSIDLQNYTIVETPQEISAPMMVACHTLPYPYAVLYCHSQETQNKVFKVSLGGENGDRVEAVAVCHMDTSQWGRNHVSFRVLGIEPGTPGVCHFFPADNFVLIPVPTHTPE
ncbi:BURP domain-containing protein BNM2A-like [Durio zibethinus]|uniref:BURP domain-containing protein BNM2A-like n=1 Tax=Durio zibethinus TaxID=66656 RepID=A0A6P6ABX7_DURZI|nr:BURP domain-containing protein BNM2A-like [Durio zibethinus]